MRHINYEATMFSRFVFSDTRLSLVWLVVRLYVGWEWFSAGIVKMQNPLWWGDGAGAPLAGFIQGALQKTTGLHPDVQMWYASFLQNYVLPHVVTWSNLVALGEVLVGVALLAGFLVGVAAFFGAFMNFNYLLAGTVSMNPTFFFLGILLILAWRISGYLGFDYYVLPKMRSFFGSRK
ncbi:MAG: TQO small subunit DoxD [Candidatus Paceibacterota bacterium]